MMRDVLRFYAWQRAKDPAGDRTQKAMGEELRLTIVYLCGTVPEVASAMSLT